MNEHAAHKDPSGERAKSVPGPMQSPFCRPVLPDPDGFFKTLRGEPTERVHIIELYQDHETNAAVAERYGVWEGIDFAKPEAGCQAQIAIQRFLGYDFVPCTLPGQDWKFHREAADDPAGRVGGRSFVNLETGPVTTWEEFEAFPWPDPDRGDLSAFEWYEKNLPDDMFVMAWAVGHFAEHLVWLTGYETLCTMLFEERELLHAIAQRLEDIYTRHTRILCSFPKVRALFPSDDMGFRTGTLIAPDDLRAFVLPGHKKCAEITHASGRPYFLHSCGQLESIMPDLLDDVKIDARHSFEDTITPVREAYKLYGNRIAICGGMDLDFICRSEPETIRAWVRATLDLTFARGRYFLGTGNSVANYVPVDHYLAMLDEGRKYTA